MTVEIKVPVLPESVADATIATWYKQPGDIVSRDEKLVDIETDKVVLEVVAPDDGIVEKIIKNEGDTVNGEEIIAVFKKEAISNQKISNQVEVKTNNTSPAVRRMLQENHLEPSNIKGTGKSGRITTEDVKNALKETKTIAGHEKIDEAGERIEKRVPMTRLRSKIAERLLGAQHNAAILTTFNEINLQHVIELRNNYKEQFEKEYGVRLGFMSFFTAAVVDALKKYPLVNASIDGQDIVYHGYFDIGIAVSSPRGLVVPIIRDADKLSMADTEKAIKGFGQKAQDGQLTIEEMTGGTFTISNGGVFGSLLSTPILNPPQSAILGMHKIEERPIVENGEIVIRLMMYVALSYDHRIIDGADSVGFLATIKELLEEPARQLLEI